MAHSIGVSPRAYGVIGLLSCLLLALPEVLPGQATVDLPAIQDVFVTTAEPDSSQAALPSLFVGLASDPGTGPQLHRSLIRFDLAGALPAGAEVQGAVLRLHEYTHTPVGAPATLELAVSPLATAWGETTATWSSQPGVVPSPVVRVRPGAAEGWVEWDVTAIVEDWLAGAKPNLGFGLRSASETALGGWGFRSRESTINPPQLRIAYDAKEPPLEFFRRGDSNDDGRTDITDAILVLGYLFSSSAAPSCMKAADVNDDGKADISDPISLLGYLFLGTEAPRRPFAACGADPTEDSLDCAAFSRCPGSGLIRSVTLDRTTVCPGESLRVTVVAEHPDGAGKPVTVSLDGKVGAVQHVQFAGAPGPRRLLVVAGTSEGHRDSREIPVTVADCGPGALFPIVRVRLNLFRPRIAEFVVVNASELVEGPAAYSWDFGDGGTLETAVPAASHRYDLWSEHRDDTFVTYQAAVTVKPQGGAVMTARKTVTIVNLYAWNKARGSIQPPVEWDDRLARVGPYLVGTYRITNLEDDPVFFHSRRVELEPCDPGQGPSALPAEAVRVRLEPRETLESVVTLPAGAIPGHICRVAVHLEGSLAGPGGPGAPASASLYVSVAENPFLRERERDYDILRALNMASAAALVTDPDRIDDEDLHRLAREGRIDLPVRGRVLMPLGDGADDIGDECTPGEPLREGLTCQATSDWTVVHGFVANARKGELLLSPGCGLIRAMLQQVNPPQLYGHIGIVSRNNVEITHSTTCDERLGKYPAEDDPDDAVTDGIANDVLRYQWPGAVIQTAESAFRGEYLEDPAGDEYLVGSFGWHPQLCDGEQNLVPPQVVKPPLGREAELAGTLGRAADAAVDIAENQGAHYRFYSYTDGAIALDDASDGPDPDHRDATCCSVFLWEAFRHLGDVELEGEPEPGEEDDLDALTPDGLYLYGEEERAEAARFMYDTIYDHAFGEGGWLGVLFADAPDDLANQICNCFAFDECGQAALDSSAWEAPGIGRTVSPDDTLKWDPYGRTQEIVFRSAQWARVFRVAASAGTGTVAGRVLGPGGELVEGASVELVSMPDLAPAMTDAEGEFLLEAIPAGSHALRATQLRGGLLYESCPQGAGRPAEDCGIVAVRANQTSPTDLRLGPPSRNSRRVTFLVRGTVTDDEDVVADEVGDRDFSVALDVSPIEREATRDFEVRCVGGEVRVLFSFRAALLDDDLSAHVEIEAELREGQACDTDDREDQTTALADIFEDEGTQLLVSLENSGAGGGDTAEFVASVFNEQAP